MSLILYKGPFYILRFFSFLHSEGYVCLCVCVCETMERVDGSCLCLNALAYKLLNSG